MGQYFIIANISKGEYLHPHKFGEGLKILEFGCDQSGILFALSVLLMDGHGKFGDISSPDGSTLIGSWAGDSIVVAGDYADEGSNLPAKWFDLPIRDQEFLDRYQKTAEKAGDVFKAGNPPTLYHLARLCFSDISNKIIDEMRREGYPIARRRNFAGIT